MQVMMSFHSAAHSGAAGPVDPDDETFQRTTRAHLAFERDVLRPRVSVISGVALRGADETRTVTFGAPGDGEPRPQDALGGFYVLECEDVQTVVELAERYPMPPGGHIQVRPIIGFDPRLREVAEGPPQP